MKSTYAVFILQFNHKFGYFWYILKNFQTNKKRTMLLDKNIHTTNTYKMFII